jgi:hypothetical protein
VAAVRIRTNVSFRYPAEFVAISDVDGVLAISGAQWFVDVLRRIPRLEVNDNLCQEDWGVVAFIRRNSKKFWIGLSLWPEGEHAWLAHFHHGPFAWWQRLSPSGQHELRQLVADAHDVLASDPAVYDVVW